MLNLGADGAGGQGVVGSNHSPALEPAKLSGVSEEIGEVEDAANEG
jgi:hypothetical protein